MEFSSSALVISCFLHFSPARTCILFALTAGETRKKMKKLRPEILIFDVDGVLVDVRGTYWRSALETVLYLGDNIDDALAARDAGVPFLAIIAPGEHGYRQRAARFRALGALALLPRANELSRYLKKAN